MWRKTSLIPGFMLLGFTSFLFGQQAQSPSDPQGPDDVKSSQLIVWSEVQRPQPVPEPLPPSDSAGPQPGPQAQPQAPAGKDKAQKQNPAETAPKAQHN
jgi:hypothetical protein